MHVSELESRRGVTGTPAAASAAAAATKALQLLDAGSLEISMTDAFLSKVWVEGTRRSRCCCCSSAEGTRCRGEPGAEASGSQIGMDVDLVSSIRSMLACSLSLRCIMTTASFRNESLLSERRPRSLSMMSLSKLRAATGLANSS